MDNVTIEKGLINYACHIAYKELNPYVRKHACIQSVLSAFNKLEHLGVDSVAFDKEKAWSYLIVSKKEAGNYLRVETLLTLQWIAYSIVEAFVELDAGQKEAHHALHRAAYQAWPLYSRHLLTNEKGFDLQEYGDFFEDLDKAGRREQANKLFKDWGWL